MYSFPGLYLITVDINVFSSKSYDESFLNEANQAFGHSLCYYTGQLTLRTVRFVDENACVCIFIHDRLTREVLSQLKHRGCKLIALRCAGFNNVDLDAAAELGQTVVRVPAYSPESVAEHTVGLMLTLSRRIHRAYNRVREGNFSLKGLIGFELHGKVVGIVGTGRIGTALARILHGFGARILATDVAPNKECRKLGVEYADFETLCRKSDIISLHCPLTPDTYHLIDDESLGKMKQGAMLINTSRGAVVDAAAVIVALKSGKLGYLGLDVYEQEEHLFFEDLSDRIITDDVFERLLTFPNVLITGHQAFFTNEAMQNIARTTLNNIRQFEKEGTCENTISAAGNVQP